MTPAAKAPIIAANCINEANQANAIIKRNEINNLDSQGSRKRNKSTAFRSTKGPINKVPMKNSRAKMIIFITTMMLTAPLITILLTTAKIIRPKISSKVAAPRIVLASRVLSLFISLRTLAVIPMLVALKVAPINKLIL
ncbi:Uncharacterised protein [Legionella pneumophila]|nr:Uncharacterised protein [Legionella pneumophila]